MSVVSPVVNCDCSLVQRSFSALHLVRLPVGANHRMWLSSDILMWSHSIRYLGVHVLAGKTITFDVNPAKRSFYAACNAILSHSSNLDELVQLRLQEAYCLLILTYSIAALDLKAKQLAELNVCWNSVYRHLFGFHKWESVSRCINGVGRLDFLHVSQLAKVKYYFKTRRSASVVCDVFWAYLSCSFLKKRNLLLYF